MNNVSRLTRLLLAIIIILLGICFLGGCAGEFITEVGRCFFINQKIDAARDKLDDLDRQMALAHRYQVFEVGTLIYDFDINGERSLKVLIHYPKDKNDSSPVVLFSHGLSGSAESQEYLLRGLARRGNIVIAPDHIDGVNFDRIGLLDSELGSAGNSADLIGALVYIISNLSAAQTFTAADLFDLDGFTADELAALINGDILLASFYEVFGYRIDDLWALIDVLAGLNESDPTLGGKLDLNKLILGGHSLGGASAIGIAMGDNQFKAMFCLSPATQIFSARHIAEIEIPSLYLSGDLDDLHANTVNTYNQANTSKIFGSIRGGGHLIFTDHPFLYGAGMPFLSHGEIGFTDNLPFDGEKAFEFFLADYPAQLSEYQGKALTITKLVSAFIDLYVNENVERLPMIKAMNQDDFIAELILEPQ